MKKKDIMKKIASNKKQHRIKIAQKKIESKKKDSSMKKN